MSPDSPVTHAVSRPANQGWSAAVRLDLLGYWYGNGFSAGVPATLS